MSVFTFAPMRQALPQRMSLPKPSQVKLAIQMPSFSGMRLTKNMPLESAGAMSNASNFTMHHMCG